MLTKKSSLVLLLILFSLILTAYSRQVPQAPTAGSDTTKNTAVQEKSLAGNNSFISLNPTDAYTYSVYLPIIIGSGQQTTASDYTIVDTGQINCYNNQASISCPQSDASFYGQDAQYDGFQPNYVDNGDGTVTDNNTGLMWQQDPGEKVAYTQAVAGADTLNLAGYDDWRLPTIKELYSLILFSGTDPSGCQSTETCNAVPFIDTNYFAFEYGDTSAGERVIDAQYWSATEYVSTTMNGNATVFGVNFADGRIKGYPRDGKIEFVRYVRGNPDYGINKFIDNGDNTISDQATGLMWQQVDSSTGYNWQDALNYCQGLSLAGYDDWRLPNAKELQSIIDYTRSPDTTNSAAIDPVFSTTSIIAESGNPDYPFYWTSTTHANMFTGSNAAYVAFGEALGYMNNAWIDVHGAGAQRSDPKSGDPANWPTGNGPQGDAIRIYNYARCVRDGGDGSHEGNDDSTTSAEAAGHTGGNSGQGGDLLYRWGNPQAYDAGGTADQQLFVQHDAQWIPSGYPGAGNILVFNNGTGRADGNYSSVDEIIPPVDSSGNYTLLSGSADEPHEPVWTYTAASPTNFYANRISGAQRLANGNTLICDGPNGTFFEVTPENEIVWTYDYEGEVFRITRYAPGYPGLPI